MWVVNALNLQMRRVRSPQMPQCGVFVTSLASRPNHWLTVVSSDIVTYRVAIVGAGPAGYFAAQALLNQSDTQVEVDLFERLPTPWGLVRSGVALSGDSEH